LTKKKCLIHQFYEKVSQKKLNKIKIVLFSQETMQTNKRKQKKNQRATFLKRRMASKTRKMIGEKRKMQVIPGSQSTHAAKKKDTVARQRKSAIKISQAVSRNGTKIGRKKRKKAKGNKDRGVHPCFEPTTSKCNYTIQKSVRRRHTHTLSVLRTRLYESMA
jgi:hypothetical protein